MTIKKSYQIGDTVWIHGIGPENKLTKGKVIFSLQIPNYSQEQYVIEIPTHIEPLLEVRSWDTISQDEHGPVGSLRDLKSDISVENKKINQLGYYLYSSDGHSDKEDPTPEEIMAALEKSKSGLTHKPMSFKEPKKRKYYPRRKKQ